MAGKLSTGCRRAALVFKAGCVAMLVTMCAIKYRDMQAQRVQASIRFVPTQLPRLTLCPVEMSSVGWDAWMAGTVSFHEYVALAALDLDTVLYGCTVGQHVAGCGPERKELWERLVVSPSGKTCHSLSLDTLFGGESKNMSRVQFILAMREAMENFADNSLELHVHGEDEGPGDRFFVLSPDADVQLTVTSQRVVTYNRDGSPCRGDAGYSSFWCQQRCVNGRASNRSGCGGPWSRAPAPPSVPLCANESQLHSFYVEWLRAVAEPCEHCPAQCTTTQYDIFVNEQSRPFCFRGTGAPPKLVSLKIRIANRMEVIEEQLAYGASDLLADIGGNVGLFLGYSGFALADLACHLVDWWSTRADGVRPTDGAKGTNSAFAQPN